MKKILSLLGTITLIGTSTTSLVACNTSKYTEEKLAELKEENKININGNTLEWMAPQEKPFNKVDNKWYFVIWRGNENVDWRIVKFKNNIQLNKNKLIENIDGYKFGLTPRLNDLDLSITTLLYIWYWLEKTKKIKSVYRWDGKDEPKTLIIDPKTEEITDWNKVKEVKKDK